MQRHRIEIEGSDQFFECREDETVLHAALRSGIGLPYECSSGSCGTCLFQRIAGSFETMWEEAPGLSARARQKGDRMLACQNRPRASGTIKTVPDARYCPPVPPAMQTAELTDIARLTPDMSEFTFKTPAPARFAPGQYFLLSVAREVRGARAYSMSNLPNGEGKWQVVVKRKPGGACTDYLFNELSVGGLVGMAGPYGLAYLRDGCERDLVGVAGGSGLSPILSIVRKALLEEPIKIRQVHLFLGGRRPIDIIDPKSFADIGERADGRLHFYPAISETAGVSAHSWSGDRGFIHEIVAQRAPSSIREAEVFVAGPPPMIRETLTTLSNLGVPREQVHFDNFF